MFTSGEMMLGNSMLNGSRQVRQQRRLVDLFNHETRQGRLNRWIAHRLGHSTDPPILTQSAHSSHYLGIRSVALDQIRGSESRRGDFDLHFHPLDSRMQGRWVSVAQARQAGITLPAVELIKVGSKFYVRDGHHRISVAHAFGESFIEAEVTEWFCF